VHLSFSSLRRSSRRGTVALFVAVCLTVILAVVAISLDGGILLTERRHAQAVADAAAHAAAVDIYQGHSVSIAQKSALFTAAANGYANDGTVSIITPNLQDGSGNPLYGIWIPPISGDHVGDANYAEVVVQWNQGRSFSSIFGSGSIPVRARAVAGIGSGGASSAGILVLDPTKSGALAVSGSASVRCNGPIIVDSNDPKAVTVAGASSVTAPLISITGNDSVSGAAQLTGTVKTGVPPTPDPLAALAPPDPASLPVQSKGPYSLGAHSTATLSPGVYVGGISLTGSSSVTLLPGIYYIKGGGFNLRGSSSVNGSGVMIYNDPLVGGDAINLGGAGSVTLSPPTSGPFSGITLFQNRNSNVAARISGNSDFTLSGTFYLAGASLTVHGHGSTNVLGSQYISRDLTVGGSGSVNISYDPKTAAGKRSVQLVE